MSERSAQRLDLRRIRHAADHRRDAQALHVAAVDGAALATWIASSRVGVSTSTRGP
jgi:hypothetical protein